MERWVVRLRSTAPLDTAKTQQLEHEKIDAHLAATVAIGVFQGHSKADAVTAAVSPRNAQKGFGMSEVGIHRVDRCKEL